MTPGVHSNLALCYSISEDVPSLEVSSDRHSCAFGEHQLMQWEVFQLFSLHLSAAILQAQQQTTLGHHSVPSLIQLAEPLL